MDRKTSSIITDIATLNKDANNIKSEQPFGYDTLKLKMIENSNSYDEVKTLAAGDRAYYTIEVNKVGSSGQDKSYTRILYQIWVNNMSTPYYGETSGLGVFTPMDRMTPFAPMYVSTDVQMINSSASPITFYIKVYAITTHVDAEINIVETF